MIASQRVAPRVVGLPDGFHFHHLRHTGKLTAASGASTRELMHRLGHASMRAALTYQHAVASPASARSALDL
jgi:integrase